MRVIGTTNRGELKHIVQDGKKFVVKIENRKTGFRFNGRYLTLEAAQEARDNAIRGQGIVPNGDGSRQASADV